MMEFVDAIERYRTLTPEQKLVLETREIQGNKTAAKWLHFLKALVEFDTYRDKSVFAAILCGILAFLLSIGSGLYAIHLELSKTPHVTWLLIPALLFFVLSLILFSYSRTLQQNDLPNHLRKVVFPLLQILSKDLHPEQKIQLCVRLHSRTSKENLLRGPIQKNVSGGTATLNIYQDQWLSLETEFPDQTKIVLSATDLLKVKKTRRRNTRGKIKFKQKAKLKTTIVGHFGTKKISGDSKESPAKEWNKHRGIFQSSTQDAIIPLRNLLLVFSEHFSTRK